MINKTYDGRRSVAPTMNQQMLSRQQQENIGIKRVNPSAQNFYTKDQIQELIEDEDHSSVATSNRISQMMQIGDDISNRPSVFSLKNQDVKYETGGFTSKTNSPF